MKTINETFDDRDFKRLEKRKNKTGMNWRKYLIACSDAYEKQKNCEDDCK